MAVSEWLYARGHHRASLWVEPYDNPISCWLYRLAVPGPNDVRRTLRRPVLCRGCDGKGGETEWICDDGGPFYPCGACDDDCGMMTWLQCVHWWMGCEKHCAPVAYLVDAYYGAWQRWYDWRDPRCEACGWPVDECRC